MSQFREGSLGRFESQEAGIPVYLRAARNPEFEGGGDGEEEDWTELMPALMVKRRINEKKYSS
jgi:hypothetical protein